LIPPPKWSSSGIRSALAKKKPKYVALISENPENERPKWRETADSVPRSENSCKSWRKKQKTDGIREVNLFVRQ
jgi:hypothetical protein